MKTQSLPRVILLFSALLFIGLSFSETATAQNKAIKKLLKEGKLPSDVKLMEPEPYQLILTTDYINRDIEGNIIRSERFQGTCTRGNADGKVRWNNAKNTIFKGEEVTDTTVIPLDFMEGLSYNPSDDLLNSGLFANFPATDVNAHNMIWDMLSFETFAWNHYDSLRLNQAYASPQMNGDVVMANLGVFNNNNIIITLTGASFFEKEPCAVIEFITMDNPLRINVENGDFKMSAKGRSHYWGTIYMSLRNRQFHYAILHEDVLLDMVLPNGTTPLLNSTRLITLERGK